MSREQTGPSYGLLLLALAAAAATALSIYLYFNSEALNHTAGALLVTASSAVLAVAALVLGIVRVLPRWLRGLGMVLLLIDIFGTGIAAWFSESRLLMAGMAVALLGWLLHLLAGPRMASRHNQAVARSAA